jgi:small subunit ribosomal protein S20
MPNIKSSKKAVKVIAKKTLNNHEPKAKVKNLIRNIDKALKDADVAKAENLFKDFQKAVDDAVSKGLIKSNTADREKSRLAQKIKNAK